MLLPQGCTSIWAKKETTWESPSQSKKKPHHIHQLYSTRSSGNMAQQIENEINIIIPKDPALACQCWLTNGFYTFIYSSQRYMYAYRYLFHYKINFSFLYMYL